MAAAVQQPSVDTSVNLLRNPSAQSGRYIYNVLNHPCLRNIELDCSYDHTQKNKGIPRAVFHLSNIPDYEKRRNKGKEACQEVDAENLQTITANQKEIRETLSKGGINTKDSNHYFVILQDPDQLDYAMRHLGFDKESQNHMADLLLEYKERKLDPEAVRPSIGPSGSSR